MQATHIWIKLMTSIIIFLWITRLNLKQYRQKKWWSPQEWQEWVWDHFYCSMFPLVDMEEENYIWIGLPSLKRVSKTSFRWYFWHLHVSKCSFSFVEFFLLFLPLPSSQRKEVNILITNVIGVVVGMWIFVYQTVKNIITKIVAKYIPLKEERSKVLHVNILVGKQSKEFARLAFP